MGKTNESLTSLQDAISFDDTFREGARTDPGFDKMKDDEQFKKLIT